MISAEDKKKLATHLRDKAHECLVPPHIIEALVLYAAEGIEPGSFCRAVLENNLMEAMEAADIINRYGIHEICSFIYSYMPNQCHGSPKRVEDWIKRFHEERTA